MTLSELQQVLDEVAASGVTQYVETELPILVTEYDAHVLIGWGCCLERINAHTIAIHPPPTDPSQRKTIPLWPCYPTPKP